MVLHVNIELPQHSFVSKAPPFPLNALAQIDNGLTNINAYF